MENIFFKTKNINEEVSVPLHFCQSLESPTWPSSQKPSGQLACFLLGSVSSKNVKKDDARVRVCVAGKGGDCADGGGDGGGFNSLLG